MSEGSSARPEGSAPPFPPARGPLRRWAVELAIVAVVAFPFAALTVFGDGRDAFATIMVVAILGLFVVLPALVARVAYRVWIDGRDARASAAAIAAMLGWVPATRGGRAAFVGVHRGRAAAVQATVRFASAPDGARRRIGARPTVRLWFEDAVGDGPHGVDLPVRGLAPDDVRAALDVLAGGGRAPAR